MPDLEAHPAQASLGLAALVEGRLSTGEWISDVRSGSGVPGRRYA